MPNQVATAEIILLKQEGKVNKYKVHVTYDDDMYLVLVTDDLVTVYREQELPDSLGTTVPRPTGMVGIRGIAIECARRVRYGEAD